MRDSDALDPVWCDIKWGCARSGEDDDATLDIRWRALLAISLGEVERSCVVSEEVGGDGINVFMLICFERGRFW